MSAPADVNSLTTLAQNFLKRCALISSADAEVFLSTDSTQKEEWSQGRRETSTTSLTQGIGLRLIEKGRLGFGYLNSFEESEWEPFIRRTHETLKSMVPDPHLILPTSIQNAVDASALALVDPSLTASTWADRAACLPTVDAWLAKRDSRLKPALRSMYAESREIAGVFNSKGMSGISEGTSVGFMVECIAEANGETQLGYAGHQARFFSDLEIERTLMDASEQATLLLGSGPVPTGRYDILLPSSMAPEFLELFMVALRADQVHKGKSFLKDRVGQRVISELLTLVDDPHRPKGLGSSPIDGEGIPTARATLIEKGILKDYLFDALTAHQVDRTPTGQAARGSFKSLPHPGVSNFFIQPGKRAVNDMVSSIQNGLLVFSVMGLHTVDTVSGDFSLGLMGQRIENGKRTTGVRGVTIAGNLLDFFSQIEAVADDLRFQGSMGSPTLWIRNISIGGAS